MKIRSFFGQSILLNKMIRIEQRQDDMDMRFFIGKNEMTNQPQKILKLNIIYGHHDTFHEMAPFGIYFTNSAPINNNTSSSLSSSPSNTIDHQNTNHFSSSSFNNNVINDNNSIPDSLIIDALDVWLDHSKLASIH